MGVGAGSLTFADWALVGGMVGVIVFTLLYGLRSQWWRYIEGIALFSKSLALALISILSVGFIWFGDYPGRQVARAIAYGYFFLSSWFFVGALVWRQHQASVRLRSLESEYAEAQRAEGVEKPVIVTRETIPAAARAKLLRWLNR